METSILDKVIEDAERFPEKRRRLARILVADIASEEHLRSLLLEGLLHEAATRRDLKDAEDRLRGEIERLRIDVQRDIRRLEEELQRLEGRIDTLNQRIDGLVKWIVGLLASIWAMLVALLIPLLLRLLGG